MRTLAIPVLLAGLCTALAQEPGASRPVSLMEGLSNLHHPVSTKSAEAQKFFDQGLRLVYAFNHEEAARSFRRAGEHDSKIAMTWWAWRSQSGQTTTCPSTLNTRRWRSKQ